MRKALILGILTLLALSACNKKENDVRVAAKKAVPQDSIKIEPTTDKYGLPVDSVEVSNYEVKRNESLYYILDQLGFGTQDIYAAIHKAEDVADLDSFKPGQKYRTYTAKDSTNKLRRMVWHPNLLEYVVFDWTDSLNVYRASLPLTGKRAVASGKIENSLYQTVNDRGASPLLAQKLSEVFAWQINFFGLRSGDSFKTLYNRRYINDTYLGMGDLMAAEFTHRGKTFRAYKFTHGELDGYFNEKGESVEKALLKAPFKFDQRISSPFNRNRFHPILKKRRPHTGIDYAAPYGTPVLSVGDGVVTKRGYGRGSGYIVKIRHNSTFESAYMHLSDFADGIRVGSRVEQGQIIAYVGNSGMSTGSHLHYSLYKHGSPVNALAIELPSSKSVPDSLMDQFTEVRDSLDNSMQAMLGDEKTEQTRTMMTNAR